MLLQLKDSEVKKLIFAENIYKPFEYEKWVMAVNRLMDSFHPEIGAYWLRVSRAAKETYRQYLKDLRVRSASMQPIQVLNRTQIESRIE